MKLWIIGNPAAGKSTLAAGLADRLGIAHIPLDELFWAPGWSPVDRADFLAAVGSRLDEPHWVVDGQYEAAVDEFIDRAEVVIWLDVPLRTSLPRLVRRTAQRLRDGTPLWGGNRETLWTAIGPSSIVWYAISIHRRYRRRNLDLYLHLRTGDARLLRARSLDPDVLVAALGNQTESARHQQCSDT